MGLRGRIFVFSFFLLPSLLFAKPSYDRPLTVGRFFNEDEPYPDAVRKLDRACEERRERVREYYRREKKGVRHRIGSLSRSDRRRRLRRIDKKYDKALKKINDNCGKIRKKLKKKYKSAARRVPPAIQSAPSQRVSVGASRVSLDEILAVLRDRCERRKRAAQREFQNDRRRIFRSLGSLQRREGRKRADLKRARFRLAETLKDIRRECEKEERRLTKLYLKGQKALPSLNEEPAAKVAQKPVPQRKESLWAAFRNSFQVGGSVKQEAALRVESPRETTKNRSQIRLFQSFQGSDRLRFRFSERAYYDAVFDATDNFSRNVEDDQESDVELRDAYMDVSLGPMDMRLGNQQIVWGETIGLFIADVVTGKDFREYILPDFDLIRLHQVSAEVTFTHGGFTHEWIATHPEFNKFGVPGSEFAFPLPVPEGTPVTIADPVEPPSTFNNGEYGLRLSQLIGGLDAGAFVYRGWDKTPVLFRRISGGVWQFSPAYRRQTYVGATFSKDIWDVILKGESVVTPGEHFVTFDPSDSDGIKRKDVVNSALGLDYSTLHFDSNVQWISRVIRNAGDLQTGEKAVRHHVSVWVKRTFLNGKVEPEILAVFGLSERDTLYRPKVGVRPTGWVRLTVGADFFDGKQNEGLFGIFKRKDRVYAEMELFF